MGAVLALAQNSKIYNNRLWLLFLCEMQKGYCLAMALRRRTTSSSGGGSTGANSSFTFFDRGCLTILAVGKAVSGELTEGAITWMTLGFI